VFGLCSSKKKKHELKDLCYKIGEAKELGMNIPAFQSLVIPEVEKEKTQLITLVVDEVHGPGVFADHKNGVLAVGW
jgi:hypothetical protein